MPEAADPPKIPITAGLFELAELIGFDEVSKAIIYGAGILSTEYGTSEESRYRVFTELYSAKLLRQVIEQVAKSNDRLTAIIIVVAVLQVVVTAVGIYVTSK